MSKIYKVWEITYNYRDGITRTPAITRAEFSYEEATMTIVAETMTCYD